MNIQATPQTQSLKDRLANSAKEAGRLLADAAQDYAMQGVLARLACSPYKQVFMLKGGMMYNAWGITARRYTRDIDFKASARFSDEQLSRMLIEILSIRLDDALVFDTDNIRFSPIMKGSGYQGTSAHFAAYIGTMRLYIDIDVGIGDPIIPKPQVITIRGMLGRPDINLLGYSIESVIAEKIHSMVEHGNANSRMKDFFDVYVLSRRITDAEVMRSALVQSFAHRRTPLPTKAYLWDESYPTMRQAQWEKLISAPPYPDVPKDLSQVLIDISVFLEKLLSLSDSLQRSGINYTRTS